MGWQRLKKHIDSSILHFPKLSGVQAVINRSTELQLFKCFDFLLHSVGWISQYWTRLDIFGSSFLISAIASTMYSSCIHWIHDNRDWTIGWLYIFLSSQWAEPRFKPEISGFEFNCSTIELIPISLGNLNDPDRQIGLYRDQMAF